MRHIAPGQVPQVMMRSGVAQAAEDVRSPMPGADWIKVIQERDAHERARSGR